MAKKSLLEEAIVEAKQLREATLHTAVKQLEENLTPSIKKALANQLEEELDVEDDTLEEETNSGFTEVKPKKAAKKALKEEEKEEPAPEEKDVEDEKPAEDEAPAEEPKDDEAEPEDTDVPAEDEAPVDDEAPAEDEKPEEITDDTPINDLTVSDLENIIMKILANTCPEPAPEGNQGVDDEPADVQGQGEEELPMVSANDEASEDEDDLKHVPDDDDEIDISEVLEDIDEDFEDVDKRGKAHDRGPADVCQDKEILEKKLREANEKVNKLKKRLEESNLTNRKLLNISKILVRNSLSESQKTRVVESINEAKTSEEIVKVSRMLVESFKDTERKPLLRENRRFASSAAGMSTAAVTQPVDETVRRFQQLAGIID